MAPTLLGAHAELTCRRCGYRFVYGLDDGAAGRVLCPNCGNVQIEDTDPPALDGDRVLVDRSAFRCRSPHRWEPVAFRSPSKASDVVVKRVVGLPGEAIEIRDGDIYADGRIQRKSLAEQRAMAILVHDSASEDRSHGALKRWRPEYEAQGSTWKNKDGRFVWTNPHISDGGLDVDWLGYHPIQLKPGSSTEMVEAQVSDICGYNQTQSRLELNPVRDLAFSCRLRAEKCRLILVEAYDSGVTFWLRFDITYRQVQLYRDDWRLLVVAPCEFRGVADGARLYVSLIDQQVCAAWNDEVLINYPYERSELKHLAQVAAEQPRFRGPRHAASAALCPFHISSSWGEMLEVWDLRLERDIYYTPPPPAPWGMGETKARLGPGEYFVLGDNSPQSRDSRWHDFGPGIPEHLLIGKPFLVYFPARLMHAGGRSFQVPEFSNIRYIR
jgi:type IV secretory pathway protease TraF